MRTLVATMLVSAAGIALAFGTVQVLAFAGQGSQGTCTKDGVITTCPQSLDQGRVTTGADAAGVTLRAPGGSETSSASFTMPASNGGKGNGDPVPQPPSGKYAWVQSTGAGAGVCPPGLPPPPGRQGGTVQYGIPPSECGMPAASACNAGAVGQTETQMCLVLSCPSARQAASPGFGTQTSYTCAKQ